MLNRWEKVEDNKIKLEVEIPAPEVDTALDRAYRKVVKNVNMPGFRKGKVPRHVLESYFGPEVLHEDVLENLVPPAYQEALEESKFEPINQPDFELVRVEAGKPLLFNATIEVMPEAELAEYIGLEVEQDEVKVEDIQVDHHLYMLREQNARLVPREDEPAREGDLVTIDFQGFVDGELFEGGEAEDYSLELGSRSFVPGFEEQLVGVKPGEEKEVKITFPDNYGNEELSGKEAIFQVKMKKIKEKQLPELNDDFVKEVSELDTLDEMKADLKEKMLKNAEEQSRIKLEESLIEKIASASKVSLPKVLVERQIDRMVDEMSGYLRSQGLSVEQFMDLSGKSMEELREQNRPEAEKRTKANLVLDAIAKKEGFSVDDSEVDSKINEIAETYNDQADRVKEVFEKQGRIPAIREELRIRKVIDLMVENAEITRVKPGEGTEVKSNLVGAAEEEGVPENKMETGSGEESRLEDSQGIEVNNSAVDENDDSVKGASDD